MQAVSAAFLDALQGSYRPVVKVDAWRAGRLLSTDADTGLPLPAGLPLADGQLTAAAGSGVRTTVSLTIADTDGRWRPRSESALSPYGSELHISAGLQSGPVLELVSLGWFRITKAATSESYYYYALPTGQAIPISRGQTTKVDASDRAVRISRDRFLGRTQPQQATVFEEIGTLVRNAGIGWVNPGASVTNRSIPAGVTYSDDRLGAITTLATAVNAELAFTADGVATLISTVPGSPVWAVAGGIDTTGDTVGVLVNADLTLDSDQLYNGVISRGKAPDGTPLEGSAIISTGPLAWGGPMGHVPFFQQSDFDTTQAQVTQAAEAALARLQRERSQQVKVACAWNPALELGDVITLQAPHGSLPATVIGFTLPLHRMTGMELTVAVDPELYAEVS